MIHINVNNPLYKSFWTFRAFFLRFLKPKKPYFLAQKRSLVPISKKFGFDRGLPIDRYYIEQFLHSSASAIVGACLEIHDNAYTKRFGGARVHTSDILDIDTTNHLANIFGDLQNIKEIADNSYDCLVITQTFGLLPDLSAAARECFRILKPGGSLIATFSTLGPLREQEQTYWRFTPHSVKSIFSAAFQKEKISIRKYGNVLSCQSFLVGFAANELTQMELDHADPWYPLIIGLYAVK